MMAQVDSQPSWERYLNEGGELFFRLLPAAGAIWAVTNIVGQVWEHWSYVHQNVVGF